MIKVSYLVLATLVMARTPQYVSDPRKDIPVISELESDRTELPIQYAPGLFLIDIRQEEWFLVFEYVYYYKAEELGDVNQAKKFIERRIIQELSAEYSKSTNGGKNDIYEQLNQGFKYRFFFRNRAKRFQYHCEQPDRSKGLDIELGRTCGGPRTQ